MAVEVVISGGVVDDGQCRGHSGVMAAGLELLMPCHSSGRCFTACSGTVPLHLQQLAVQAMKCPLRE